MSFIDEHAFGDLKSFREQFANLSHERVFDTLKARHIPHVPAFVRVRDELEAINCRQDLKIDSQTCEPLWSGERMDYGLAVEGLWAATHGRESMLAGRVESSPG